LEQKKTTLTDTAEIKTINKQINALQEEYGRLRKEIQYL
jgi:chaperonin cofactor prefoldin